MFTVSLDGSSFQTTSMVEASLFSKSLKLSQTIPKPENEGDKVPLRLFDPGFRNTAVCKTEISSKYTIRGYPIEELFHKSSFLEVAYLLIYGKLPAQEELTAWCESVMTHTYLHQGQQKQMETFRYDSHPMSMLIATISSLSTFTPDANPAIQAQDMYMKSNPGHIANRNKFIYRALGKIPSIAAHVYRHRIGRAYNDPMPNSFSYCENLLFMMDKLNETNYTPDARLVKILDKLFILLCEDGVTCSTVMMRHLASSGVDPYTALSGAAGALFGERKTAVVVELITRKIKTLNNLNEFIAQFKKDDLQHLDGFEISTEIDPRVELAKSLVLELFDLLSCNNTAKIAVELEKLVMQDKWFTSRNFKPTIDFWTGIAVDTLGFPTDMYPVWMFIPRVAGLISHLIESIDDPEYKIFRPRQIFTGSDLRKYEQFPTKDDKTSPVIESQNLQYFRPGFELPTDHDIYQDLDFDKQFSTIKESSGGILGSKIRSWLSSKQSQSNMRQTQAHSATTAPLLNVTDGSSETAAKIAAGSVNMVKGNSSRSINNEPNLLAGSNHSRVISQQPK